MWVVRILLNLKWQKSIMSPDQGWDQKELKAHKQSELLLPLGLKATFCQNRLGTWINGPKMQAKSSGSLEKF